MPETAETTSSPRATAPIPFSEAELDLARERLGARGIDPRPVLGQEMRWVHRQDLASLEFPPADDELIRKLTSS